jgi:hypothetical protein
VTVWLPASRTASGIAGTPLGASTNLGHRAEARCTRWGRSLAGEVVITVEVVVTSPPGVLPALQGAPARPRPAASRDVQSPHVRESSPSTPPALPALRGERG